MADTLLPPQLNADEISNLTRQTNYGTWRVQKTWKPLFITDAEGCWITDGAGKRYLDFSSQLMCVNLGHKNPRWLSPSPSRRANWPSSARSMQPSARPAQRQAARSTARGAGKILLRHQRHRGQRGGLQDRPHGTPAKTRSSRATVRTTVRQPARSPLPEIRAAGQWSLQAKSTTLFSRPRPIATSARIRHTYPGCNIACVDYIEHMIENESDVAAIIVEPVVGTNGVLIPPPEYFPRLREICDRHGVLMIADEVMTGWGRTGKWFAVDHWGVKPDILVTAKGITSAYVPLGLCATTKKLADYFEDHYFSHGHTYEAHPITLGPAVDHHRRNAAPETGRARRRTRTICPPETRRPERKASIHRRCSRPGPLLRRRTGEEPRDKTALQHHARQG